LEIDSGFVLAPSISASASAGARRCGAGMRVRTGVGFCKCVSRRGKLLSLFRAPRDVGCGLRIKLVAAADGGIDADSIDEKFCRRARHPSCKRSSRSFERVCFTASGVRAGCASSDMNQTAEPVL
jgi:hypothetical protein